MKIISKIFPTFLGFKITNVYIFYSIYASKLPIWTKMVIFTPIMAENIFEIIFILTAAKNHTSNFADGPFGSDYCSSSNASLTAPSNQHYFSMYFQNIWIFFRFVKNWKFSFNWTRCMYQTLIVQSSFNFWIIFNIH